MSFFQLDTHEVQLSVAGRSDTGQKRADNQDDFLVADLSHSGDGSVLRPESAAQGTHVSGQFAVGQKGALLIVADGMGGGGGALASRLATTWVYDAVLTAWSAERSPTPDRFAALLRQALEQANARIHTQATSDSELRGMGTTTTAVGVLDGYLHLAHVGDSRAYLLRAGQAVQLTRDQSMVQALIDAGTMTEEQAEASTHRSVILQALGIAPTVKVELSYKDVQRGDIVLLCSDGLSRVVRREEIASVVAHADELAGACDRLISLANERGGPDNITVVLARLDGAGLAQPQL